MSAKKRPFVKSLDDEFTSNQPHYHKHAVESHRDRQITDEKQDQLVHQKKDADRVVGGGGEQRQDKQIQKKDGADDGPRGKKDFKGCTALESHEEPEFIEVNLQETRMVMQCPICLGIIRKTRTILACLHRFCKECIDKSMRLGNKECPTCRRHCSSRRAMRDDPLYDEAIACVYPDIDKYEKEELELLEEEMASNKQVQASFTQIAQLQSKALRSRKRLLDSDDTELADSPGNQVINIQRSEDDEDHNPEEMDTEITQIRRKRHYSRTRSSRPSSSIAINAEQETTETQARVFPGLLSYLETWGTRGARSRTRNGISKSPGNIRLSRFVAYLQSLHENNYKVEVHLMLVSVDNESKPSLPQPNLCCQPYLSINHIRQYVSQQTNLQEVEMFVVKECNVEQPNLDFGAMSIDPSKAELEILEGHETLSTIRASCICVGGHLVLAYGLKKV